MEQLAKLILFTVGFAAMLIVVSSAFEFFINYIPEEVYYG